MRSFKISRLGGVTLAAMILVSCLDYAATLEPTPGGITNPAERVPYYLEVDPRALALDSGEIATITPTILDQFRVAFDKVPSTIVLSWTTHDTAVVTVNEGRVTARSPGFTTITVNAPGIPAQTIHVGVFAIGTLLSEMNMNFPGDTAESFTISSAFDLMASSEPPAEWADARYDVATNSWSIRATWQRSNGVRDILEISRPANQSAQSNYLVVLLWLGVNSTGQQAVLIYEGDTDTDAVQFRNAGRGRLAGEFEMNLYGEAGGFARISGTFNVPIVKNHALPAP